MNMTLKTIALTATLVASQVTMAQLRGLPDFTPLVEDTAPAVVNIRVTQFGDPVRGGDIAQDEYEDLPEMFRRYFERQQQPQDRQGAGSGFIIDADGYVVTNDHVINGADEIVVRMADRREFIAELVGTDPESDIALLKVSADERLPALEFGDSMDLQQGEWVMAIGSPFNFDQTVTAGIVSAKGRSNQNQSYVPFIQTDVAINRGNSGGPLLNMAGEVVGVNSWILTTGGGYVGLSFSIPAELVRNTVTQLRENGVVRRGLLGVQIGEVTREMAEAMSLDRPTGALVNTVNENSAAAVAGIEDGDIILSFDGRPVETHNDLPPLVGANPPGTRAEVVVSRDGRQRSFEVILDALEPQEEALLASDEADMERDSGLGLAVEDLSAARRAQMEAPDTGVLITEVSSDAAYRAGLRPGDILLRVNNRVVANVEEFQQATGNLEPGRAVAVRLWRGGQTTFLAFTPDEEDVG